MFEEIHEQDVIRAAAIPGTPYVYLLELHLAEPALRQTVAAVGPGLGVEELAVYESNLALLALDEPRRAVVVVDFGRPYCHRVAGAKP